MVNDPKCNGECSRHPCIIRILCIKIPLNHFIPFEQTMVHFLQKVRMHKIICIKDGNGIIVYIHLEQLLKHPLKSISLTLFCRMCTFTNNRPRRCSNLRCTVAAIICNNINIIKFIRIIEAFEILDQLPNNSFLVMCCNNDCKFFLRCEDLFLPMTPQTTEPYTEKI